MARTGLKHYEKKFYGPLVGVWLSLSIAGVLLSMVTWKQLSDTLDDGIRRAEFNDALDKVFDSLQDAETGQRGYLLTGKDAYLVPYTNGVKVIGERFERLAKVGLDDTNSQTGILRLSGKVELRLKLLRETIEAYDQDGSKAAGDLVRSGEGKAVMDEIRTIVDSLRSVRPDLLTSPDDPTRQKLWRAIGTSSAAGLVGVGAGLFAFFLTRVALTQEKRERALAEAKLAAEKSSEHKSAFMANMSHEIRTPMNAILGFSDLLDGELRDPRQRQWLRSIRASGQSLLQLINDVLDMSKIEAGVLELHPEPTDPREICDFIRTVFTEQATRKGVKLACVVAQDLPRALLLDRTRLRQVLVNLVGNAVKFTDHGFVRIGVRSTAQRDSTSRVTLEIEVEDTGIGIPEDRLDVIFKPFAQADSSRSQERQGTGLGLAIVKRLVEAMRGTVRVASVVGKGTTFHVRIPDIGISARLSSPQEDAADAEADFNTLRPATILVVDDNELNRQLMAGIFQNTHHVVHFGTSGQEAVEKTVTLRPDAVLLDIRMPGMDGREALRHIRSTPEFELTPVIAVTASSMADEERSLRKQFNGYLRKPFTRRALLEELGQYIPKASASAPPAAPQAEPVATTPDAKARLAELSVRLRALEAGDWALLRDSVAINESRRFARQLSTLASAANYPPLARYAETLLRHAEAYDANSLENELAGFPGIIAEAERLSA